VTVTGAPELPTYPYLGLRRFEAADSLLYHGRDGDLRLCHDQLLNPAVRVLVLHGLSGSGKSSFLRAGLMPQLGTEAQSLGTEGGVIPISAVVTAGPDMLRHLAEQVYRFVIEGEGRTPWRRQLTELAKRFGTCDAFIQQVANEPGALMEFIGELSHNPRYVALIAIDQVEEYFTGPGAADVQARKAFLRIVDEFARERLNGKLVLSLRTEQYGVFASHLPQSAQPAYAGVSGIQRVFHHYLANPQREQLLSLVKAPAADYGFEFEPDAAEHIVDRLVQAAAGPEMSVLPLLQTVLLRLYLGAREAAASQGKPMVITRSAFDALYDRADGKSTGFISDFVDWGLSEAVRAVLNLDAGSQSERVEVSCWHEVLRAMSSRTATGVRIRDRKSPREIELLALKEDCRAGSDKMADALSAPGIGLFSLPDVDGSLALRHDIICLSFDLAPVIASPGFWVQAARKRRRRILEAVGYRIDDLFDAHDRPATQTLRVSELRFWDHKSLAYADHLGLFARLGLEVEVVPVNDDILAKCLSRRLQQTAGAHAVFSYPRVLMNGEELEESQDVVVLNSFTGYAVVCNRRAAELLPTFEEKENWGSFERVCTALMQLCAEGCRFEAEDDGARDFLGHIFDIYRDRPTTGAAPAAVDRVPSIAESSDLAGVAFVDALLHAGSEPMVAVVTTPTWALAVVDERSMRTIIDQRALLGLLDSAPDGLSPALATLRRKLEMRNVMNLRLGALLPGEDAEALMLRLVSIGLFVADCIWAQDREAGKWIRKRWIEAAQASGHQVSLPAFLRAFRRSYAYVTAQEHGRRYYGTAWDDDCPKALRLHQRWQEAQMSYERQLAALTALQKDRQDATAHEVCHLVRRARRHADIENYYDAERLMSQAVKNFDEQVGVVETRPEGEIS
jgi:hypothetical protein